MTSADLQFNKTAHVEQRQAGGGDGQDTAVIQTRDGVAVRQ